MTCACAAFHQIDQPGSAARRRSIRPANRATRPTTSSGLPGTGGPGPTPAGALGRARHFGACTHRRAESPDVPAHASRIGGSCSAPRHAPLERGTGAVQVGLGHRTLVEHTLDARELLQCIHATCGRSPQIGLGLCQAACCCGLGLRYARSHHRRDEIVDIETDLGHTAPRSAPRNGAAIDRLGNAYRRAGKTQSGSTDATAAAYYRPQMQVVIVDSERHRERRRYGWLNGYMILPEQRTGRPTGHPLTLDLLATRYGDDIPATQCNSAPTAV